MGVRTLLDQEQRHMRYPQRLASRLQPVALLSREIHREHPPLDRVLLSPSSPREAALHVVDRGGPQLGRHARTCSRGNPVRHVSRTRFRVRRLEVYWGECK